MGFQLIKCIYNLKLNKKQHQKWSEPRRGHFIYRGFSGRIEWTRTWEPLNENLRVKATDPHLLNEAKGGVIDVKGGATLAKHRFALAYGKHKVGKIKKSELSVHS